MRRSGVGEQIDRRQAQDQVFPPAPPEATPTPCQVVIADSRSFMQLDQLARRVKLACDPRATSPCRRFRNAWCCLVESRLEASKPTLHELRRGRERCLLGEGTGDLDV